MTPNDQSKYEAYADDFKIGYDIALQQRVSRFRDKVKFAAPVKADGAQIVDHLMPFEAEIGSGDDYGDTKWTHASFMPRWAFPKVSRLTVPVSTTDKLAMLSDPTNELTQSILMAHNRSLDRDIIVPAFFRDVVGGKDKTEVLTFPASQVINQNVGGNASGINRDKIDAALELFETNEVDTDEEMPWQAITPRQHTLMRNLAEVSLREFEKFGGRIEKGKVKEFLGMQIMVSNKLTKVTLGGVVYVESPIWVPSGMCVQPWLEPKVRIGERPDKNYTVQLYSEARYDAIRTEEQRVIKVLCSEEAVVP